MKRIDALYWALGLLEEHANCGNDTSAEAALELSKIIICHIKAKARRKARTDAIKQVFNYKR